MAQSRRSGGSFRERRGRVEDISESDLTNPWNFFKLFMSPDDVVITWCREHNLIANTVLCSTQTGGTKCGGTMDLKAHSGRAGGAVFRCRTNRNHEKPFRTNSFFEKSNLTIQDIMLFVKSYLDKCTLLQCSIFCGLAYGTTAVNWASFIRELFKEHFHRNTKGKKLQGEIEIDESLFGRRVKYHRGNPNAGLKIWVFGMVERESNTIILYPVSDRTAETLIPIIERHVQPGSTIYSDGWSAYCNLNNLGYDHFTVLHKYSFKKIYVREGNPAEKVEVHTNRIEGAWRHAKDHFRKMSGTKLPQFEGHLAEVMWRSEFKSKHYEAFFDLVRQVYPLDRPPQYHYTTPLFHSWRVQPDSGDSTPLDDWSLMPGNTDAETEAESDSDSQRSRRRAPASISPVLISSESETDVPPPSSLPTPLPPNRPKRPGTSQPSDVSSDSLLNLMTEMMSSSSISDDDANKTLVADEPGPSTGRPVRKTRMRTDKVCHPAGFKELQPKSKPGTTPKGKGKGKKKATDNPYSKSAFIWSDDDDFVL